MSRRNQTALLLLGIACGLPSAPSGATTLQTEGAGSAVTSVDRSASFDALDYAHNDTHLDNFTEGGLAITTSGNSWVGYAPSDPNFTVAFDPFHGANGNDRTFYTPKDGNNDWVTIRTTDATKIFGVEFMYGNGWTTGQIYGPYPWGNHDAILEWQTWNGDTMVSSGSVGGAPLLEMGTVLGWIDPAGFDRLLVRATIASSGDPTLQALALDNLNVQTTPVPELSTLVLVATGLGLFGAMRRGRSAVR